MRLLLTSVNLLLVITVFTLVACGRVSAQAPDPLSRPPVVTESRLYYDPATATYDEVCGLGLARRRALDRPGIIPIPRARIGIDVRVGPTFYERPRYYEPYYFERPRIYEGSYYGGTFYRDDGYGGSYFRGDFRGDYGGSYYGGGGGYYAPRQVTPGGFCPS